MITILNQALPLYFMLLPLGIAALLAYNLYRVQGIFIKLKANYQNQLREAQNRLDEVLNAEAENIERLTNVHREKLNKLESDAVEREALIVQLNKQVEVLRSTVDIQKLVDEGSELIQQQLNGEISELKDLNDILYNIVQANSRSRKAYSKYLNGKKTTETPQSETVVHDALGIARVFEADQSESVNNRHRVVNICNEVNRGIAEQVERIRQELEVVDMSQLESGDMVKLRNKENRTVIDVFNNGALGRPFGITINKGTSTVSLFYDKNGHYDCVKHGFDIIQIIKPAK